MAIYFTSDPHVGHDNIRTFCDRPYYSVAEMNDAITWRWNAMVTDEDTVYILGDLALGKLDESLEVVSGLLGNKYLVPGNHDRMFGKVGDKLIKERDRYLDAGIVDILPLQSMFYSQNWLMCHFPYDDSIDIYSGKYMNFYPKHESYSLLHGHVHGYLGRKHGGNQIDVGMDAWGGWVVSESEIHDLLYNIPEDYVPIRKWVK